MKILLATDGSAHARLAETLLLKVPKWKEAEVTVVSVMTPPLIGLGPTFPGEMFSYETETLIATARDVAVTTAEGVAARLKERGVNAHPMVVEGDPGGALLETVGDKEYDLVAIGSRGQGSFESFFLGSVARKLVSHSPVSVLVARPGEDDIHEVVDRVTHVDKLNVLVAVDGSKGSELATQALLDQGEGAFAKAIAFCAEPLSVLPAGIDADSVSSVFESDHKMVVELTTRVAEQLSACADVTHPMSSKDRPSVAIRKAAEELDIDLISIGATRHGLIERFLLGSVSYEVATEAPCSVLVVRV